MTAGKRLAGGERLLLDRTGGRFQQECYQHCVECLEERIAPASEEPVHVLAKGSEPFPFWCAHIQQNGYSGLFLSTPPQPSTCYGFRLCQKSVPKNCVPCTPSFRVSGTGSLGQMGLGGMRARLLRLPCFACMISLRDQTREDIMLIGYARVSTFDQTLELQRDALTGAGCSQLFTDRLSGARERRPGLDAALSHLRVGDTLVVWRLDRLGRSLKHLIETVQTLEQRGVGFRSLTEQIDTTTPGGTLIFHVFAALAQFERALIVERTQAGLAAARAGTTRRTPARRHSV